MSVDISPQERTAERTSPRRRSPHLRPARLREYAVFLLLVGPNLFIIALFDLWPTIYNAFLSLTSWDMISPSPLFVGLDNYTSLLTDRDFLEVLLTTAIFTVAIVGAEMTLGLGLAVLLNQKLRGRGVVRTLAFAPYVLSGAAVAMMWLFIFDPNYGLARLAFDAFGQRSPNWTTDSDWALLALIIVHAWKGIGFAAIVYLAALQARPEELYEAASLDGAGPWRKFISLTIPLLSPTTFFLLIVSVISTTQAFDMIAVMTNGGPGTSTTTLSWFIYSEAFQSFNLGKGAAGAMILFAILLVVTAIQRRIFEGKVHYQ